MRTMLPLSLLLFAVICFANPCRAAQCEPGHVSPTSVNYDAIVRFGYSKKITSRSCYLFTLKYSAVRKPKNISDAIKQIEFGMPYWMKRALVTGRGHDDCQVNVNGLDYFGLAVDFYIDKWVKSGLDFDRFMQGHGNMDYSPDIRLQDLACKAIKGESG